MNMFKHNSPSTLFAALAAGVAIKYAAGFLFQRQNYRYVGRVDALRVYPLKSCHGISVQEAECLSEGLAWNGLIDRHWVIATAKGNFLTMRQLPTMGLIKISLKGDNIIELNAPGMEPISFPAFPEPNSSNLNKVTVFSETLPSVDLGDEVGIWLSRYLKRDGLRLHYSAPSLEKRELINNKKDWECHVKPGDKCAFPDYCGYMLLSNGSLSVLNTKLKISVPMKNFRPNIIVDDCKAFAEDSWRMVRIGDAHLRALDPSTRCILTTVNQDEGKKDKDGEPLATLKKFRCKEPYGQSPCFGLNLTLDKPGTIRVGDPIYAIFP